MSSKSVFANPRLKAQKASRNAFDLGHKRAFHASLGQILPIFHADVPAGSYIELGEENQTYNMNPLVRPAFTRIKEHIDYFAVPKVQLWSLYDNFITGQSQYMSSSLGSAFLSAPESQEVPMQLPMFNGGFLSYVLENKMGTNNPFGVTQLWDTLKLLDLLGYGNFYTWLKDCKTAEQVHTAMTSYIVTNMLPQNFMNLLAYQKIYYSYFRNSKYEKNIPTAYNLDWLPKSLLNLVGADFDDSKFADIFTLHYRWLKKDYFMSMQPSVLPTSSDIGFDALRPGLQAGMNNTSTAVNTVWQLFSLPGQGNRLVYTADTTSGVPDQDKGNHVIQTNYGSSSVSTTNVSALRFAFAFDKLLRRMRSAGATFDDQMLAQFGIKPIDMRHGDAYYLGGFTNRLNLNEVISTSEMRTDGLGQFGSNISKYSDNPKKITYHAKEDVIIMGIYSTSYDVDYPSCRYERDNLRRFRFDHYNSAFENLGLQAMYNGELCYIDDQVGSSTAPAAFNSSPIISPTVATGLLGFNKRYIEYKTKLDVVNGLFDFDIQNADMMAWTTQYRPLYFDADGNLVTRSNQPLAQPSMLVNPIILDDIVTSDYNGTWEHDHFMCNLYNKCTMIANMSVDGEVF